MQFDNDMQGEFAEMFLHIRETLLSMQGVKEHLVTHQTSYKYKNHTLCMLRGKDNYFTLAFNFGYRLVKNYSELFMTGKIVAHWRIYEPKEFNMETFLAIIEESKGYIVEKL